MRYTLEEVSCAFESWRENRCNRREPIPESLWEMTRVLVPHYQRSHIQKVLRICGSTFNARCLVQPCHPEMTIQDGFASAVLKPMNQHEVVSNHCELTLKGQHKSLFMKVEVNQLSQVLPLIEVYL